MRFVGEETSLAPVSLLELRDGRIGRFAGHRPRPPATAMAIAAATTASVAARGQGPSGSA